MVLPLSMVFLGVFREANEAELRLARAQSK
jgi:hypothetical protein